MKKILQLLYMLLQAAFILGCDDIIAPDISQEAVRILAPGDGAEIPADTVIFWWEGLESETAYQVQIVSPSFDAIAYLLADTLVYATQLKLALMPGNYAFRVRADNGAYYSAFSLPHQFSVSDSSRDNGSNLSVQLVEPLADLITNESLVNFSWKASTGLAKFKLNVSSESFMLDTTLTGRALNIDFPKTDATYQWQVEALCDTCSQAIVSRKRSFSLDFTVPETPLLQTPIDNAIVARNSIHLEWEIKATDVIRDSLYVFGSNQKLINGFPKAITETSYNLSLNSVGIYFWQLKSVDKAGNQSLLSEKRSIQAL